MIITHLTLFKLRSPLNEGFGTRLETEAASLDQSDWNPSSKNRVFHCYWYNFHSRVPSSVWFQRTKLFSELESRHSKKEGVIMLYNCSISLREILFPVNFEAGIFVFLIPAQWMAKQIFTFLI